MFTYLGPNSAQSSEGFRIERSGRTEMRYFEGDKTLIVEVEPGAGLALYTSSIVNWLPPYDNRVLTERERHVIVDNIRRALDFLDISYTLEP